MQWILCARHQPTRHNNWLYRWYLPAGHPGPIVWHFTELVGSHPFRNPESQFRAIPPLILPYTINLHSQRWCPFLVLGRSWFPNVRYIASQYLCTRNNSKKINHNHLKLPLILLGIRVQPLSGMRGFLQYGIIIHQKWYIYTYVALVLKETTIHILYKSPHFVRR